MNHNPNFLNWINYLLYFYLSFMQTIVNIKSNQIIVNILILSECYYKDFKQLFLVGSIFVLRDKLLLLTRYTYCKKSHHSGEQISYKNQWVNMVEANQW